MNPTGLLLSMLTGLLVSSISHAQVLASYEAGVAGSPTVAPDPATQGWTLEYPTGTGVVINDASPDGATGLNAWSISDQGSATGQRAHYFHLFTPQQLTEAFQGGWELEIHMRVVQTAGFDVVVEFADGQAGSDRRYLAWYESVGNDVLVSMSVTGNSYTCPNAMDGNHHTFLYRKQAGVPDAEFHYDGQLLGPFPAGGSSGGAPNGGVTFGTGSSAGQGTILVNSFEFRFLANTGDSFCEGDGSGMTCPCGNLGSQGAGCQNSTAVGGLLSPLGDADLANDSFMLAASQCPPFRSGVFIQATGATNSGAGSLFGDGLLCVQGGTIVLQFVPTNGAGSATSSTSISQAGSIAPGDTRYYQYWYRDQIGPCAGQFNLTNGHQVTW